MNAHKCSESAFESLPNNRTDVLNYDADREEKDKFIPKEAKQIRQDSMMKYSELSPPKKTVDVRVVGVGGMGCSALTRLAENISSDVTMLAIDTGSATQGLPERVETLSIGNGFGSGGDIDSALSDFMAVQSDVESFVGKADVVIVLAGLGRGTGSGLAPVIAKIARAAGALSIAAVNMPFVFEGRFRNQSARKAHFALENATDAVITMYNDDLSKQGSIGTSLNGEFESTDRSIANAANAITTALGASPERFDVVRSSLAESGKTAAISGSATGLHAGSTAVAGAFDAIGINETTVGSAVLHVVGGIGLAIGQVVDAVAEVRKRVGNEVEVHVSSQRRVELGQNIDVAVVLAGIETTPEVAVLPVPSRQLERRSTVLRLSISDALEPQRTRGPELLPTG